MKVLVVSLFLIGAATAQSDPSVSDAINSLPPELQGKVDEEQVKELQKKSTELFKEKCEKNGGPDAFTNAQNALKDFQKCIEKLVDTTTLQKEIEEAKPNGQIDEVFKKYCAKTPEFKACFKNMTVASEACLSVDERGSMKTVHNVSEQLAEFVCFKEGDRIALFIAEGGPECFQEKQEAIQVCVNRTLGSEIQFDPNNITANSIPKITFGEKECTQFTALQKCVVSALESCDQPTSANIVESLFKFARKSTPCKDYPDPDEKRENKTNSANSLAVTIFTITSAVMTALLY